MHRYSASHCGKIQQGEIIQWVDNSRLDEVLGSQVRELRAELVRGTSHAFGREADLAGRLPLERFRKAIHGSAEYREGHYTHTANGRRTMDTAPDYLARLRAEAPNVLHWDWEQTLERAYCRCLVRGASAVDVGGHTGRHARALLETAAVQDLVIVEPLPQEYAHLTQAFGGRPGVRIVQAALSRDPGRTQFIVNTSAREESGLRQRSYNDEAGATLERIEVEVTTLDKLFDGPEAPRGLDFVKIDVEGAELDVLAGGERCIRRHRPLVSVEYGSPAFAAYGRQPGDLYDLAMAWDYRLTDLLGHGFETRTQWLETVDAYYWDYLMLPHERAEALAAQLGQDAWPVARPSPNLTTSVGSPRGQPGRLSDWVRRARRLLSGARGASRP